MYIHKQSKGSLTPTKHALVRFWAGHGLDHGQKLQIAEFVSRDCHNASKIAKILNKDHDTIRSYLRKARDGITSRFSNSIPRVNDR